MEGAETSGRGGVCRCYLVGLLVVLLGASAVLTGCAKSTPPQPARPRGVYHQVQRGQTLWGIARAYKVDVQTIARANHLPSKNLLEVGQQLYIPGASQPLTVASRCPCGNNTEESAGRSPPASSPASPRPVFPLSESPGRFKRTMPATEETRFAWPIEGMLSRGFEQNGQQRHDGIDILAPKDTPIRAAADGEVLFSDWGPGGYGRLVILRHSNDMVSLYAHNERNLVQAGQTVRQGDQIATVGKTGRATAHHVHFEIRQKTVPVSPLKHLPPARQMVRLEPR